MSLDALSRLSRQDHPRFRGSVLSPVAPEWSTADVLLGGAYRKLILGVSEADVSRERIADLPEKLRNSQVWKRLLQNTEALASPAREKGKLGLPNVIPFVPELGRYGCVTGRPRRRWDPGNLLINAIASGVGADRAAETVEGFAEALSVGADDDVFARWVEEELKRAEDSIGNPDRPTPRAPLWRGTIAPPQSPAEQFCIDLKVLLDLKGRLTRRQWTILVETLLRLGLGTHFLWLLRVNREFWRLARLVVDGEGSVSEALVEEAFWRCTTEGDPLVRVSMEWKPQEARSIRDYAEARIGVSILLYALDDAGCPWPNELGVAESGSAPIPEIVRFFDHCAANRESVREAIGRRGHSSLRAFATTVADSNGPFVRGASGPTKNISEFISYVFQQLRTKEDDLMSYDQAYLCQRRGTRAWIVRLGPNLLVLLVHACCIRQNGAPASLDDLKSHLAAYGIRGSITELQEGSIGRELERLGLVVDSPDAGGGRLLVDPF